MFTSINAAIGAAGGGMKVAEAAGHALKKVEWQRFERGIAAG